MALLVLLSAWTADIPAAGAAEPPRAAAAVNAGELDASINEVLAGRDFQWRLRPAVRADDAESEGPLKRFVRKGLEAIRNLGQSIRRLWNTVLDWLERWFPQRAEAHDAGGSGVATPMLRMVLYVFAAAALVLICVVITLVLNARRRARPPTVDATGVTPAEPNLADESSHAGLLAPEGWLDLARQQLARGEWRLALRALYLATLARLAADGLVSLAKFKTNLDYEREARRRSLGRREVVARFATRRVAFEAVWYGNTEPRESEARDWLVEMEGPRLP